MLFTNLAVLLAERNLKITKLSNDTGISRTTLTALCNNYSQGIQFDTLNKLCSYLNVQPKDFFVYIPYDYSIYTSGYGKDAYFEFTITTNNRKNLVCLFMDADEYEDDIAAYLNLPIEDDDEVIADNLLFRRFFNALTIPAKQMLEEQLKKEIASAFNKDEDFPVNLYWDLE